MPCSVIALVLIGRSPYRVLIETAPFALATTACEPRSEVRASSSVESCPTGQVLGYAFRHCNVFFLNGEDAIAYVSPISRASGARSDVATTMGSNTAQD
jgi:hypothetical protein